jgi:hypothetical protein
MKLSKCIWLKHEITKMPLAVHCTIHLACAPHEPLLMMVRQQSRWDDGALNNPQEDLNLICDSAPISNGQPEREIGGDEGSGESSSSLC